ncbi:MAG TPA: four helix bundle protein [Chitinophagales bacterium]|nr:four helix bundle protein [Chitinophagales bacterium]
MVSQSFRDLTVFKRSFSLAMEIYEITKKFPKEETYSLTDQIRRSSRSVCTCIGEAYRKRLYQAHFISKCSDADAENTETQIWLDFSLACNYISNIEYDNLIAKSEEVGRLINHMIENPEKYLTLEDKKKLSQKVISK